MRVSPLVQLCFITSVRADVAFISTLSSESYALAAKVLAFALRDLHPHTPYVILATEDISNDTVKELRSHNIDVRLTLKVDTPYIADHRATKFQYTKIRLWSLTSFSSLVHLDLDLLPLRPIDGLFKCGTFCASLRHSDMFNSGVFVMKPDMEVYKDMLNKSTLRNYSSYDGGDQGFLNTYFSQMKYGAMFSENGTYPSPFSQHLLSAAYNYDVAMYYLNNGVKLIEPAIIHYTLGPVKPWKWWTFPLFDLNYMWLDMRQRMEATYGQGSSDSALLPRFVVVICLLAIVHKMIPIYLCERLYNSNNDSRFADFAQLIFDLRIINPLLVLVSLYTSFCLIPERTKPVTAWFHFTAYFMLFLLFLTSIMSSLRTGRCLNLTTICRFLSISISLLAPLPVLLLVIPGFIHRSLFLIAYGPLFLISMSFLISTMISKTDEVKIKYELVPNECKEI